MALPLSYSWRNVLARPANTFSTALAIALWAFLFLFFSGFVEGLDHALQSSGSTQNMLVLRATSSSETNSSITREQADILGALPQVARNAGGQPELAAESIVLINLPRIGSSKGANVTIRGVKDMSFDPSLGRRLRIVEGRMFRPSLGEIIVSRNISRRYQNCQLGSTLHFQSRDWKIVGVFQGAGTAMDSEIWGDRDDVMSQFRRDSYSSVTFRLASPADTAVARRAIAADQRLQLDAQTERQYYNSQQQGADWMKYIFYTLTLVFSFSMFFAAANAIYAAVQARTREIGTLRAIGFSGAAIMQVFTLESICLGILGGVLGVIPALVLIPQLSTGTTNFTGGSFSDLTFQFRLTPQLIGTTLVLCCIISLIGGLLPSVRASRIRITQALREL